MRWYPNCVLTGSVTVPTPKVVKVYADVYSVQVDAVKRYVGEVKGKAFPAEEHTFTMKDDAVAELRRALGT